MLKDALLGSDITCFTLSDQPDMGDDGDNGDGVHHRKTEHWVSSSIISLFVLFGLAMVFVAAMMYLFYTRRQNYQRI